MNLLHNVSLTCIMVAVLSLFIGLMQAFTYPYDGSSFGGYNWLNIAFGALVAFFVLYGIYIYKRLF